MSQFTKKLKDANKLWKAAKQQASERGASRYAEYDDGKYVAKITSAKLGESQSSQRLQVTWTFTFQDGPYEGKNKLDFSGLETENNLYYLAQRLQQLGYEMPESLDEIEDVLEDVTKTKPMTKITLKTKGDFQNVYIDKVYASGGDEDEAEEDDDAEEEAPEPAPVKGKGKKTKPAPEPEPEEDEDDDDAEVEEDSEEEAEEEADDEVEVDEDEVELAIGMAVTVATSKGEVTGTVVEVLADEGKVRVKTADNKVLRVPLDKLSVVEDVPDEPPAKAPAKKSKK